MRYQPRFIYQKLAENLHFTPTESQKRALELLAFYLSNPKNDQIFLLKGYAGTGKTSLMKTVTESLPALGLKSILMAPTGRAAKVMAKYTGKQAFTIHKKIYLLQANNDGKLFFKLKKNNHKNTVFIVDEASMIPDDTANSNVFNKNSLLLDLIEHIYTVPSCKLILIGDTAQLPPVKINLSPALDRNKLQLVSRKEVVEIELTEVMRQLKDAGILANATILRETINSGKTIDFYFNSNDFDDVESLTDGYDIQDALTMAFGSGDIENSVFVVRSNKRATRYNNQIRTAILGLDNKIATGDFVMVVKNNYFWLSDTSAAAFIANGDICEIMRVRRTVDLYGFWFAEVTLRMVDYPEQHPFEAVIILDSLYSDAPSLTREQGNQLYHEVAKDYGDLQGFKKYMAIKNNSYFNALQVKFAYAVTCHKAQGGQWETVFVEKPYLPDGESVPYYRWLYTAITRAEKKLYLIGFENEEF